MPIKEENIENLMNYAIKLAESSLIYEEQFKLATLCEDIFLLKENGVIGDKELENNFNTAIKNILNLMVLLDRRLNILPRLNNLYSTFNQSLQSDAPSRLAAYSNLYILKKDYSSE